MYLKELADTFGADRCFVVISPEIGNDGQAANIPFDWMKDIVETCEKLGIHIAEHICLKETVEAAGSTYYAQRSGAEIYDEE